MFTILKKVIQNKKLSEEELNKVNDFYLYRWLSGSPILVPYINSLNMYSTGSIGLSNIISTIQTILRVSNTKYIKYPSTGSVKHDDKLINFIVTNYNVSMQEAKEIYEILKKIEAI